MRQLFESMKRYASEAGEFVAASDRLVQLSRRDLFTRVMAHAAELKDQPKIVGIYAPNGLDWVIAQLACAVAGKIVVPLPTFFSVTQLGHVVRDASVDSCLRTNGGVDGSIRGADERNRHSSAGSWSAGYDRWLRPDHLYFGKYRS